MAPTQREHWHPQDGGIPEGTIRTQVPTEQYREGWDRIFGKRSPDDVAEFIHAVEGRTLCPNPKHAADCDCRGEK